jgi:hypothetical protein
MGIVSVLYVIKVFYARNKRGLIKPRMQGHDIFLVRHIEPTLDSTGYPEWLRQSHFDCVQAQR